LIDSNIGLINEEIACMRFDKPLARDGEINWEYNNYEESYNSGRINEASYEK